MIFLGILDLEYFLHAVHSNRNVVIGMNCQIRANVIMVWRNNVTYLSVTIICWSKYGDNWCY